MWVYSICMPLMGRIADVLRRDRLVLASLVLWSLATFGTWLRGSVTTFLFWRAAMRITNRSSACGAGLGRGVAHRGYALPCPGSFRYRPVRRNRSGPVSTEAGRSNIAAGVPAFSGWRPWASAMPWCCALPFATRRSAGRARWPVWRPARKLGPRSWPGLNRVRGWPGSP